MTTTDPNPWRPVFEDIRRVVGNRRDAQGALGSINWLRKEMARRGANPNVVRNIIYRDKGKLADKRALFDILKSLWAEMGQGDLRLPELELLLSSEDKSEHLGQLLGREKRRAYQRFVSGVSEQAAPKLLITGRPGSGKTLLSDYVQQALERLPGAPAVIRLEFSSQDLAMSLGRLARELGVASERFEAKLARVRPASPFAVQADAQAEVARVILDALRQSPGQVVLLLHVSQSLALETCLSQTTLRLSTPDVPRVSASEWLWLSLFAPMSRLETLSLLVTMSELPLGVAQHLGVFEGPLRLKPPTASEARRFVRARLPALSTAAQERLVQRAGRSFEDLRTLTLLADIRQATLAEDDLEMKAAPSVARIRELSQLLSSTRDPRLRDFLAALACLSLPTFPVFHESTLSYLRKEDGQSLTSLEAAFLDAAPGQPGCYRCFSRQLARALIEEFKRHDLEGYRQRHGAAAACYRAEAQQAPGGDFGARYLRHLFEARGWTGLIDWLKQHAAPQALVTALWSVARQDLKEQGLLEQVALQVAAHYVRLGSYSHPDAQEALAILAQSESATLRAWTTLKQAESAMLLGHFDRSEALLEDWPEVEDAALTTELVLVRANLARWRAELERAEAFIEQDAKPRLAVIPKDDADGRLIHAKVATWAGLIAKDKDALEQALEEFSVEEADDDILRARLAFQRGDVRMKLGQFGGALADLNEAVTRSSSSGAPPQEQARYLARRGTLRRKLGQLAPSERDFQEAFDILDAESLSLSASEKRFCRAKLKDEAALILLARGDFEAAIFSLRENAEVFEAYGLEHGVDASYRLLRNALRLSLAYGCRGLHQAYGFPLGQFAFDVQANADLRHARALAEETREQVARQQHRASYKTLHRLSLLISSLLSGSPAEASEHAAAALEAAHYPYQEARSRAYLAHAALAERRDQQALEQISMGQEALKQSHREKAGDPGLTAWFALLQLRLHILQFKTEAVSVALVTALETKALGPYHAQLLRCYADGVEATLEQGWLAHDNLRHVLGLDTQPLSLGNARLSDALVARWSKRQVVLEGRA